MDLAIVADTHIPDREESIPEDFRERIRGADATIHGGDFTSEATLEEVRSLAAESTVVTGNMDGLDLPTVATVEAGEFTVAVTHGHVGVDGGRVRDGEDWIEAVAGAGREHAEEPRAAVGAHIHEVVDTVHDGVRVLNPGSATGADPADEATMMILSVEGGEADVTVHRA